MGARRSGEDAADEMRRRIEESLRWKVTVPDYGETAVLY